MKRGTSEHPKTRRLMALLGIDRAKAVGTLHLLWESAGQHTPQGDIGRWPDEDIALAVGWDGDAGVLIGALVTCRWLDLDTTARLVVHDFGDHAEEAVKKRLTRNSLSFLKGDGQPCPDTSRQVATRPDKSRHESTASASASASASAKDPPLVPLAPKRTRSRRLPASETLTAERRQMASEAGLHSMLIEREWLKFRDYEFDKPKSDWSAAWRNWARSAADRQPRLPVSAPKPAVDLAVEAEAARRRAKES